MELREEFVLRAREKDANVSALCREYSISRKTDRARAALAKVRGEGDVT